MGYPRASSIEMWALQFTLLCLIERPNRTEKAKKRECLMKYLKIILAVLLLLCLLDMPYGFYILIRYMATVVFGYMAYSYHQNNKKELAVASGALAILFQPFVKLALGRGVWNFVDIIVAIGLIITVLLTNQEK